MGPGHRAVPRPPPPRRENFLQQQDEPRFVAGAVTHLRQRRHLGHGPPADVDVPAHHCQPGDHPIGRRMLHSDYRRTDRRAPGVERGSVDGGAIPYHPRIGVLEAAQRGGRRQLDAAGAQPSASARKAAIVTARARSLFDDPLPMLQYAAAAARRGVGQTVVLRLLMNVANVSRTLRPAVIAPVMPVAMPRRLDCRDGCVATRKKARLPTDASSTMRV